METMRLTIIILHVFIMIFAAINLHPHLTLIANASDKHKQIASIINYITDLFRILLYHTTSILAVLFSVRYGAGMVRASGILLIGELCQVITLIIQHTLETFDIGGGELFFIIVYNCLLLIGVLLTFRLAEQISKHEKDLLQVELLADTLNDTPFDNNIEPTMI